MSLPEQKNSPEIKPQISPEKLVDFDVKKETADVKKEIIDTKLSNIQEKQELFKESQNKMMGLISGTTFEKQFQEQQAELESKIPGFTLEKFSGDISQSVGEYLWQTLFDNTKQKPKLSAEVMVSLSVGIQGAMMETLKASGSSGTEFFTDFSSIGFGGAGSAFEGLFKTFGSVSKKAGNVNYFYKLANRVQNCTSYLASQAGKEPMKDGSGYKELMVSNEFRKLVNSEIWDNAENYQKKTPQELGFTPINTTDVSAGDEAFKKEVLMDTQLDVGAIAAISKALPKSMEFLNKRTEYKTQTNELMDKVGSFLGFNIAGLGTLGSLLGISSPAKLLGKSKLANFVLRIMGFDGVEGLHKDYIRNNIDKQLTNPEQKTIIKETLANFKKDVPDPSKEGDVISSYKLTKLDKETQDKLPKQKDVIVKSLVAGISGREIFLSLKAYKNLGIRVPTIKDAEGNELIDRSAQVTIPQVALEKYIAKETQVLAKNNEFMKEITGPDQFMLAMVGNLVADQYFVEGVCLGLESPSDYVGETIPVQKIENNEVSKILVFADEIKENKEAFLTKVQQIAQELSVDGSKVDPNWLMLIMKKESVSFDPTIQNKNTFATGLIQFMPETAKVLGTTVHQLKAMSNVDQLDYVKKYYQQKQFTGKINSYGDLYLATFYPVAMGKSEKFVLGGKEVADQNPGINLNKDGQITKAEFDQYIKNTIKESVSLEYQQNFA